MRQRTSILLPVLAILALPAIASAAIVQIAVSSNTFSPKFPTINVGRRELIGARL